MLQDLRVALVFLTRVPIRLDHNPSMRDLATSVHWFPVVGALIGLVGGIAFTAAGLLGLPSWPASIVAITAMLVVTGALHEDGLADTADALGAGSDRAKALAIMRDSRLGTYGTIAIVLVLLARLSALATFWEPLHFTSAVIAAAAVSRAMMPAVMLFQPSARESGLAAATGQPDAQRVAIGLALAVALALLLLPLLPGLRGLLVVGVIAFCAASFFGQRFGGCTGDTLGAVQQLSEVAFLTVLATRG